MNSDLNDRTHRIAFEVATKGQANDCHLLRHNLRLEVDGQPIDSANHEQKWEQESRHQTQNPSISAYQWDQYVQFSVDEPSIVSIYIDMLFSDSPEWWTVDGAGRLVVDTHPVCPPKYHGKLAWYLMRLFRIKHEDVKSA